MYKCWMPTYAISTSVEMLVILEMKRQQEQHTTAKPTKNGIARHVLKKSKKKTEKHGKEKQQTSRKKMGTNAKTRMKTKTKIKTKME